MITVKINTVGRLCKINLTDSSYKVKIVRHFNIKKNSEWRNTLVFLTLFEGTLKLLEKKILDKIRRIFGTLFELNLISIKKIY